MNKLFYFFIVGAALFTTSCQNDEFDSTNNNDLFAKLNDNDLTCGNNVLLFCQDTLDLAKVPLAVNTKVNATSDNANLEMRCEQDENGDYVLRPMLCHPTSGSIVSHVNIVVPGRDDVKKEITVVVTPTERISRAGRVCETTEDRLVEYFSYGVVPSLVPGEVTIPYKTLRPSAIAKYVEENVSFSPSSSTIKAQSTSMKELASQWALQSQASFPLGQVPAMMTIGLDCKKSNKSKQTREYFTLESVDYKAFGVLNDTIASRVEANSDFWLTMLDDNLNNYLHNPSQWSAYPNTEEGALKLIQNYGSHIPTQLLLGGSCRIEYSKTADLTENSFEWGLSLALSQNKEPGKESGVDDKVSLADKKTMSEIYKNLGGSTQDWSGKVSINNLEKKLQETTQFDYNSKYIGNGGYMKDDRWNAGDKPVNWVALGYGLKSTPANAKYIPLYNLISKAAREADPQVETRYQILKGLIEGKQENGYPLYLKAFGNVICEDEPNGKYVICDFVCKNDDKPDGEPFVGQVQGKNGQSYNVMYYPMRWSSECKNLLSASNSFQDRTFNTLKNCFFCYGTHGDIYQHFYYALLPASQHDGIDAITFVPENSTETVFPSSIGFTSALDFLLSGTKNINRGDDYKNKGWTRRTYNDANSDDGVRAAWADHVVPYVHYRNANSKSKPISAVCLFQQDNRVLASSAGTEDAGGDQVSTMRYEEFWKCGLSKKNTQDVNCSDNNWYKFEDKDDLDQSRYYLSDSKVAYGWFRLSSLIIQHNHIYVGYSFRPLEINKKVNNKVVPLKALLPKPY